MQQGTLILVRHGESRWNLSNRFTGWVDVPLSPGGIREAQRCAKRCEAYHISTAFVSELVRAQSTLFIVLSQQGKTAVVEHPEHPRYRHKDHHRGDIPVRVCPWLNERYYGLLQGWNKNEAVKKFGEQNVTAWRRDYKSRPPKGESLADVFTRVQPFFLREIQSKLKAGQTILVASHGNTLRAIIKQIDQISDEDIASVDLPYAKPIIYRFDRKQYHLIEGAYTFNRPLR